MEGSVIWLLCTLRSWQPVGGVRKPPLNSGWDLKHHMVVLIPPQFNKKCTPSAMWVNGLTSLWNRGSSTTFTPPIWFLGSRHLSRSIVVGRRCSCGYKWWGMFPIPTTRTEEMAWRSYEMSSTSQNNSSWMWPIRTRHSSYVRPVVKWSRHISVFHRISSTVDLNGSTEPDGSMHWFVMNVVFSLSPAKLITFPVWLG